MEINVDLIQADLQSIADAVPDGEATNCRNRRKVTVKLDRHQDIAMRSRETDEGITITLNPKRYRSQNKLDEHINSLRRDITWAG